VASAWIVALVAACSVSAGCGSSESSSARSLSDSGPHDVAVANDSGDASASEGLDDASADEGPGDAAEGQDGDDSSCAAGTGTIVVTLATPEAGCVCDWYATGANASANGSVDTGLSVFTVTCVPAALNYDINCTCASEPAGTPGYLGPCEGSGSFSVASGTTTNVDVEIGCPG
jgi:hypothetical protein